MEATRINHVSVNASDLGASVRFYVEVLGATPIATPNFGFPVQWLGLGDTQLHLFERDITPTSHHHFGVTVDDLEPVYRKAAEFGAFDAHSFGNHLVELPDGVAQLYLRDPGGNLLEVDAADASRLPEPLRGEIKRLSDFHPQNEDNRRARLYVGEGATPSAAA